MASEAFRAAKAVGHLQAAPRCKWPDYSRQVGFCPAMYGPTQDYSRQTPFLGLRSTVSSWTDLPPGLTSSLCYLPGNARNGFPGAFFVLFCWGASQVLVAGSAVNLCADGAALKPVRRPGFSQAL